VPETDIDRLADYVNSLGVPVTQVNLQRSAFFEEAGCAACHVPSLPDGRGAKLPIYSDLLLHDMGEALSSGAPEGSVSGREWRTTPLIGWRGRVPGHRFLHDGRAATIDEAIRWHGGEAAAARERYLEMTPMQRFELASFVQGLMSTLPEPLEEID
jgi:CxxC motif-containing protein (DUF1111 family)